MSGAAKPRTILMLQGPASPFWRELGAEFEASGARVLKVTFSLGDTLYWRGRSIAWRGRISRFEAFLRKLIAREGITDILLYADRLPYHVIAGRVARDLDIPVFAMENGYLRPDWITLEHGGLGAYSHMPEKPEAIRAIAAQVPDPDLAVLYPHAFMQEMRHEFTYHLVAHSWRIFYPFYRSGKTYDPWLDLLFGLKKLWLRGHNERMAQDAITPILCSDAPFFVFALQLQGDYQIRDNSSYRDLREAIMEVMTSFAQYAPATTHLVIKQHPHDNGRENWPDFIAGLAAKLGLTKRVVFIDGGDLGTLLTKAKGAVMVNSTVGLFSIRLGCPTKILGSAIYAMAGLTHQATLDSFWAAPEPVDAALAHDFVKAIAATIQVKGSFFNPAGRKTAAAEIVRRVLVNAVNRPGAFVEPPPRLHRNFAKSQHP